MYWGETSTIRVNTLSFSAMIQKRQYWGESLRGEMVITLTRLVGSCGGLELVEHFVVWDIKLARGAWGINWDQVRLHFLCSCQRGTHGVLLFMDVNGRFIVLITVSDHGVFE